MEENYINLIRAFKKLDIEDKKEEISIYQLRRRQKSAN